jgi:hypothetical protein
MALILSGDTGPSFVQSAAMPTGSVLQVQYSVGGSSGTSSSTTYVDDGLNVSITPKFATSKIFVTCTSGCSTAGTWSFFQIWENVSSTQVAESAWGNFSGSPQQLNGFTLSGWYVPGNTTTRLFKLQGRNSASGQTRYLNYDQPAVMSITAMEIAG